MTPPKEIRNVAASVHQRLLNFSHNQGVEFNRILQRYAAERFLYRLSASGEVDRFTLKGAALFRVWAGQELRPTRDVDFLAVGLDEHVAIHTALEAICAIPCAEDGVVFDPATMRIHDIRDEQQHGGLRVRVQGSLGQAQLHLQVDIGFGDVITPEREEQNYPTLLPLPVPRLWMYPRETLVAEKLEAMVHLGVTNSRVKDLWDVACLARLFAFDGETLQTAITETFRRRRTPLAGARPVALLTDYYEDTARGRRWQELQRQIGTDADGPARLVDVGEELRRFLGPVCDSLIEESPFTHVWPAGGPWRPGNSTLGPEVKAVTEVPDRIGRARPRRFRPYPKYKDSGVEWLGEIPAHWDLNRLRATVTGCQNGVWGDETDEVHDMICVRVTDFDRVQFRARLDNPDVAFD